MIDFPPLKEGQAAVIMADSATGHVLMLSGELYDSTTQSSPFMVFNSAEMAKAFINDFAKTKNGMEFVIYNHKQEVIAVVD